MKNRNSEPDGPIATPVRTETTLRRMWEESANLFAKANDWYADADQCTEAAAAHERAAATEAAAAASAHEAASTKNNVGKSIEAEAADLRDMVNEKRQQAGLAPLALGEPYPEPPAPAPPTAPMEQVPVSRTDNEVTQP